MEKWASMDRGPNSLHLWHKEIQESVGKENLKQMLSVEGDEQLDCWVWKIERQKMN